VSGVDLESHTDLVEAMVGVRASPSVPDAVVRGADQIELVDMTPEALRRRVAHGNVVAPDCLDAPLANLFRPENPAVLRRMTLLWLANSIAECAQPRRCWGPRPRS